ncbi:hypothetical protein GUJ93_ZPchr0009g663 [Zizania palustris]|uniref:Uncharacterized protein n=1 Tax=Zizania palustris TaxID=103762 RepID=A0A8J5RT45_ZIZPA|nr:hypothetical protein GUJ93_ZPchr0009g663 [Zizania palustris]
MSSRSPLLPRRALVPAAPPHATRNEPLAIAAHSQRPANSCTVPFPEAHRPFPHLICLRQAAISSSPAPHQWLSCGEAIGNGDSRWPNEGHTVHNLTEEGKKRVVLLLVFAFGLAFLMSHEFTRTLRECLPSDRFAL